jgi:hypothetical protein
MGEELTPLTLTTASANREQEIRNHRKANQKIFENQDVARAALFLALRTSLITSSLTPSCIIALGEVREGPLAVLLLSDGKGMSFATGKDVLARFLRKCPDCVIGTN